MRQRQTNPGAICAKETKRTSARRSARKRCRRSCVVFDMSKRLSATDISALASMKNVAKCDTWCELQNPVNHRVFERKLRPKPLGRGHVCLGVTHRVAPLPRSSGATGEGGGQWPPVRPARAAGPNAIPRRRTSRPVVVEPSTRVLSCETASSARVSSPTQTARFDRASDRDPRSGGITR